MPGVTWFVTLPEPQGDMGGTPMTKVAMLQFPYTNCIVSEVTFCNPPGKNGIPRSNHQVDHAGIFIKPFTNSPDNIIYCCISVTNTQDDESVSLVVHLSTLLRYASPQDFMFITWEEWNPMARCVRDWKCSAAAFSGQRWLSSWDEIWDFNQHSVKRLGRGFSGGDSNGRYIRHHQGIIGRGATWPCSILLRYSALCECETEENMGFCLSRQWSNVYGQYLSFSVFHSSLWCYYNGST